MAKKSMTRHMQERNAMQLKEGPGDPPKGKRSYTMVPVDDRSFVKGKGKDMGRTFSATPVPGKLKGIMRENMRQEFKEGIRTKENYYKGIDSTMTQSQAMGARKAQKASQLKSKVQKIKSKLPSGGKGMWGPMSACGTKGCK
jgi:hypothetical protein